jgi:hypothetical protein
VEAQHGGRFAVVQLFEVAEGQDFAVDRVHGVERVLDLDLDLGPDRGPAGRRQSAEEPGGQRSGVGRRERAVVERDLAIRVAALHPEMEAVQRLEPLHGQETQPEKRRHSRIGRVLRQAARSIQERLLEHVLGIDPPLQAAVEPQPNHPAEPFAVPGEELPERMMISCVDAARQDVVGVCVVRHVRPPM